MPRNHIYLQLMAPVMAALCLAGCQSRPVSDVPPLDKDAPAGEQAAVVATEGDAAAKPPVAGEAAVLAEKSAAEAKVNAEAEAEAAAKLQAQAQAEAAAKLQAESQAKTAADTQAAEKAAAEVAAAAAQAEKAHAAEVAAHEAKVRSAAEGAAAAPAAAPAAVAAAEPAKTEPACPMCDVTPAAHAQTQPAAATGPKQAELHAERAADLKALSDAEARVAPAILLARRFETYVTAFRASTPGDKIVVQVNRVSNPTDVLVDRTVLLQQIQNTLVGSASLVTTAQLYGNSQTGTTKAIHDTFREESVAMGLMPTRKVSDAPAVILNSAVVKTATGTELVMSAVSTRSGKVVWTDKRGL